MRIGYLATLAIAIPALAGCGGGSEGEVYEEGEADRAAAAIARGEEDVTLRTGEGEVRVRSDDGAGALPGGLPAYPGARRTGGYSATTSGPEGGSGQIVAMMTDDSPAEVIAYYREALESRGREISASLDMGQMQTISVADEDRRGGLTVTATDTGQGTSITIAGGRGN